MVLDVITAMLTGIGIGGAMGAFSAYLGWNASGEPFETKKFVAGLSTGIIAGVGTIVLAFGPLKESLNDGSGVAFTELMIVLSLGILGIDTIRAKLAGAAENRAIQATETKPV